MKSVTISDVAKYAGVSKSTVSQFLNKRYEYMSEKTKQQIESAIKELGYSPNIVARSLKQKSTTTIGVIVANILHVFSTQVIRAIEDYFNENSFHVIVCNADDNPKKEKEYIKMLRAKQVDGIIVFPTGSNVELYKKLRKENYPVVFMDRLVNNVDANTVLLDNEQAVKLAVDHFVEREHEIIGMISPPLKENITPRIERTHAFKERLAHHEISINKNSIINTNINEVQDVLKKMFSNDKPPTALLALNDRVLFEVLSYSKKNNIKIPNELSIIGIDEVTFAEFYRPALTTVGQPAFAMGKKAAELLLSEIKNESTNVEKQIFRFEPTLKIRESS
ncbi:substrate-binding domain-containing protein [Virgibacillus sp. MSJ-26]|uniref:LacI family DNA-binding transcriptional regulator n=1 Tax=Virgibacillus sp. MSJ-26 TaxID=2841522 RepID=UPI001C124810|nr:substrate-binding domain-containing protein [Virgibacillus sp. MSJ-26]MBU5468232.1 substrate-binding domain-containing protein [Virgibacillus sp. MSJ-26]